MVGGEGFEPSKSKTADLQSFPCVFSRVVYCYAMMQSNQANTRLPDDSDGNSEQQEAALQNEKSAQKMHRWKLGEETKLAAKSKAGAAKTSAAFWMGKVRKPSGSGLYGVQIAYRGTRHRFPLETANQAAAAEKARKIYLHLVANGAEAALAEFNPKAAPKQAAPDAVATIGQLIEGATRLSSARRESLDTYAKALRRIAVGVLEIDGTGKFNMKHGAAA
jgi:hypothetical protein